VASSSLVLGGIVFFRNFGVPPFLNFFAEFGFISGAFSVSVLSFLLFLSYLLSVCYFSLFYLLCLSVPGDFYSGPLEGALLSFSIFLSSNLFLLRAVV